MVSFRLPGPELPYFRSSVPPSDFWMTVRFEPLASLGCWYHQVTAALRINEFNHHSDDGDGAAIVIILTAPQERQ